MPARLSRRDRSLCAAATIAVHAALLVALILAARAPVRSVTAQPRGLSVFDLGGAGLAPVPSPDRGGSVDDNPASAAPALPAPVAGEQAMPPAIGTGASAGGGPAGGGSAGADPFAQASLAGIAASDDHIAAWVRDAYARANPEVRGIAQIALTLDPQRRVASSRYVGGTIGTVRGAALAGYLRGCPVAGQAGVQDALVLEIALTGDAGPAPQGQADRSPPIDDKGCRP